MNTKTIATAALTALAITANSQNMSNTNTDASLAPQEQLQLTQKWDKTFPQSDKVAHRKVTFANRYGITLAADMYTPKEADGQLPAVAVSGPFGAVKEQASGLYAQQLAERGFITLAFDPSFTGESGGMPRRVALLGLLMFWEFAVMASAVSAAVAMVFVFMINKFCPYAAKLRISHRAHLP